MTKSGARVRIMTWNIHGGVGPDRRFDLARVLDLVRRHDPDILAVQEVDSRHTTEDDEAFAVLSQALGKHAAESRLITAPDGDYGHMVISRWPISNTTYHDISLTGREPRAAIETTAETPFGPLHIVSAHLGLSFRERRHQSEVLAAVSRRGPPRSVTLGDFNDWVWHGSVQKALADLLPARSHFKTWPASCPLFALDRVYCRPSKMLVRSWTDSEARKASDHLPVIAELDLAN